MSEITVMIITRTDCGRYHVKPVSNVTKMNPGERTNMLRTILDWIETIKAQTEG